MAVKPRLMSTTRPSACWVITMPSGLLSKISSKCSLVSRSSVVIWVAMMTVRARSLNSTQASKASTPLRTIPLRAIICALWWTGDVAELACSAMASVQVRPATCRYSRVSDEACALGKSAGWDSNSSDWLLSSIPSKIRTLTSRLSAPGRPAIHTSMRHGATTQPIRLARRASTVWVAAPARYTGMNMANPTRASVPFCSVRLSLPVMAAAPESRARSMAARYTASIHMSWPNGYRWGSSGGSSCISGAYSGRRPSGVMA